MDKVRILIVEDEILIAMNMRSKLAGAGYTVCGIAAMGEDAISIAKNENPDVILMDIRLQGTMDGIEAAEMIRGFSSPFIIFTSGYNDANFKKRTSDLHSCAYLVKPVKVPELDTIIRQSLSD